MSVEDLLGEGEAAPKPDAGFVRRVLLIAGVLVLATLMGLIVLLSGTYSQNSGKPAPLSAGEVSVPAFATDDGGVRVEAMNPSAQPGRGVEVPAVASEPGASLAGTDDGRTLTIFLDTACVHCADFEREHAEELAEYASTGDVTIEYRPVALIDPGGYSSLGAEALMCAADESVETFTRLLPRLFDEDAKTRSAAEIAALVPEASRLETCLQYGAFSGFVEASTVSAYNAGLSHTPTVLFGDKEYTTGSLVDWVESVR